jgi:hypothetical protein
LSEEEDVYLRHRRQSEKEMMKWAIAVVLFVLFTVWFMLSE